MHRVADVATKCRANMVGRRLSRHHRLQRIKMSPNNLATTKLHTFVLEQRRLFVSSAKTLSSPSNVPVPASNSLPQTTADGESVLETYSMIDFSIAATIEGEESQIVSIQLRPGELLRAESGAMLYMTEGIEMSTQLQGASSAFSRMMTGQNMFLTDFTYAPTKEGDGYGTIALGTDFPSKILRLSLEDYDQSTLICQRGAYLASNASVDINMAFTKSMTSGFFGGQGFVLQRLSGQGDVLVKGGGTIVEKDLEPGQTLRVTSGSIVAFTSTIDYDVQMMPGIKNAMFGGEGLFVTSLTGPGKIWLQGMPPDRMISEIARRVPSGGGLGFGIPIGGLGGGASGAEGAAGAAGAEGAAGDLPADGSGIGESVAATDAAVEADRQATVASSGMGDIGEDSESPSALFGDEAPAADPSQTAPDDFLKSSDEPTFSDDTSFTTESTADSSMMDDETNFSTDEFSQKEDDGGFWGDSTSDSTEMEGLDGDATEEAAEAGKGLLGTLWDLFNDD